MSGRVLAVFAVKTPRPLKNRDFVTQRVWQELDREMMIFNHSVNHTVHAELLQTVYHCRLLVSLDCLSLYAACILGLFITVCCLYARTVYHCMLLVSSDCLSLYAACILGLFITVGRLLVCSDCLSLYAACILGLFITVCCL